jgi:hypothetical protein
MKERFSMMAKGYCSALSAVFVGMVLVHGLPAVAQSPYGSGPGGPILIVTNGSSPASVFYAEILLTEGLNAFAFSDVGAISSPVLAGYDVVVLGQTALSSGQVNTLSNWVAGGGNLIAMRPDKKLASLLGLTDAGGTRSEGYLLISTNQSPGTGLVGTTIQYHGTADQYSLAGATSVASLYSNATNSTPYHAVTWRSVGNNGGQAAAFAYDLATSVYLTRQGNPAWVDQNRDGDTLMRSDDLFFGATTNAAYGPPTNDWVNVSKIAIPQADEQQRLLAKMIMEMANDRQPLPRFWYFPRGLKAAVVMTGDDHGNVFGGFNGTKGRFDQYKSLSPVGASVADWEAVRGSSYVFPTNVSLTASEANSLEADGFEIGLHGNSSCSAYTGASITAFLTNQLNAFKAKYPAVPLPTTHRLHCIAWSGYTVMPEAERVQGIRFDVNYYHFPGSWIGANSGFMTGSGMPMRFCKTNGEPIDIYQAPTQMTDESGQSFPATIDQLLDRALGAEGYYGAFVANMHTDVPTSAGSDAIVNSAQSRGVPVVSARQMLTWIDARNASKFQNLEWSNNVLSFTVDAAANARGLRTMVPVPVGSNVSFITSNGVGITWTTRFIKGAYYADFPAFDANYAIGIVPDLQAPEITSVVPANAELGVSVSTTIRIRFNEALQSGSVTTNTFQLKTVQGAGVPVQIAYDGTQNEVIMQPSNALQSASGYTVTVLAGTNSVKDIAGNTLANPVQWTFATAPNAQWSLWPGTNNSPNLDPDQSEVELGTRIRATTSGYVTALRFYKMPGQPATHVGNLWSSNGVSLASVTFTNETASGWQQQALPSPVAIASNNFFVVSYLVPNGGYAVVSQYFATKGVTNGPLIAPQNGVQGVNGVYRYPSGFPTNTFNSENYWVDVVFQQTLSTNSAPFFLVTPTNRTVPELSAVIVTNQALDPDGASQALAYQLVNPPAFMSISTNGIITWTPSEAQGPSTNSIVTVVSDGFRQATNSFQIVVTGLNQAPVAFSQSLTNAEDTTSPILLSAADADGPATNYTIVALPTHGDLSGVPPTLSYLPDTNYFGSDSFTFRVNDGSLTSAVATVNILVTNVNDRPVLPTLNPVFTGVLTSIVVTNSASDVDSTSFNYTLLSSGGASISPSGIITWMPKSGPQTNLITTVVSDAGLPVLSSTNNFMVIVTNAVPAPVILAIEVTGTNAVLTWSAISNLVYRLEYLDDVTLTNWVASPPDIVAADDTASATNVTAGQPARFYRVQLLP